MSTGDYLPHVHSHSMRSPSEEKHLLELAKQIHIQGIMSTQVWSHLRKCMHMLIACRGDLWLVQNWRHEISVQVCIPFEGSTTQTSMLLVVAATKLVKVHQSCSMRSCWTLMQKILPQQAMVTPRISYMCARTFIFYFTLNGDDLHNKQHAVWWPTCKISDKLIIKLLSRLK